MTQEVTALHKHCKVFFVQIGSKFDKTLLQSYNTALDHRNIKMNTALSVGIKCTDYILYIE